MVLLMNRRASHFRGQIQAVSLFGILGMRDFPFNACRREFLPWPARSRWLQAASDDMRATRQS
jgi:hypothetical protein